MLEVYVSDEETARTAKKNPALCAVCIQAALY